MPQVTNRFANIKIAAVVILGGLSLSACATKEYVNEQIATVNGRIDAVDAKTRDALQRADAAAASAQSAGAAAQAAAADAQTANQRLDQLTPRVDAIDQRTMKRRPRN